MSSFSHPEPSLVSLLGANPALAAELNRVAEELAVPFVESFQTGLAAQTLRREDLPSLVETVCTRLVQEFLDDARVHGGYEVLGHADREEYAQLVVAKARRAMHAVLGLA